MCIMYALCVFLSCTGSSARAGGVGGEAVTTHSRATVGAGGYMHFIIMSGGSRRRYGTYDQEKGKGGVQCTMKSKAEVEAACMSRVGSSHANYTEGYCFPCIECESTACVEGVTVTDGYDCTELLGEAYSECTEEEDWRSVNRFLTLRRHR